MMQARFRKGLTVLGWLFASTLCFAAQPRSDAQTADQTAPPASSLYARMGGTATITAVVDEVIDQSASDPKLKRSFDGVNLAHVKKMLIEQICSLSGGECAYTGDTMRDVHAGHKIDQAEFYGLVEVLRDSLRRHGVGLGERNELLKILAPMKRDIVEQ